MSKPMAKFFGKFTDDGKIKAILDEAPYINPVGSRHSRTQASQLGGRRKVSAAKDGKPITKEDFVDYGKKVVQPIFEDFKRLFLDINGDFRAL
jgi:hypothetical protein